MNRIITVLCALSMSCILFGCATQEKKNDNSFTLTVTGEEHFPEGARVELLRGKTVESPESIEYLKTEGFTGGKFVYTGTVNDVHILILNIIPADSKYPLHRVRFPLEPGDTEINFTGQKYFTYKGGKYGELIVNSLNNNPDYQKAWKALLDFKGDTKDSVQRVTYMKLNGIVNNLTQEILGKVVDNNEEPLVKLLAYQSGYWGDRRVDMNAVIEDLVAKVGPEHRQSKVAMLSVKMRRESAAARKAVGVGAVIKDFEAKNLKGETFHLADVLKENKYVLVEFWASWCGPCRAEIPHMKKAYSHFKDKGFEIVSFTLDHKEDVWKKASEEEQIPWIDTGDLLANTSPVVKMYGVTGVPANYLVEASTGKIVAKNLRQEKLDEKLEELFN